MTETVNWKARYLALKTKSQARYLALETKYRQTRTQLDRVTHRDRSRVDLEIVEHLLPTRAAWRRRTPPDALAADRHLHQLAVSPSYADACAADPPTDADRVDVAGVTWWVPRDQGRPGRLTERVRAGHLPLQTILRTRAAAANGIMLDIGANIGLMSVTRALLGDVDVVYAAEPAPDSFACLTRTVLENGLQGVVLPDRVAISDQTGEAQLELAGSIGARALRESGDMPVRTETLDAWVERLGIDVEAVRFVKVDTQGHECHVLAGASRVLAQPGVVWEVEFSPPHLVSSGRGPAQLIAQLQGAFSHFVDLSSKGAGPQLRRVDELADATAYLEAGHFTDLLLYRSSPL